MERGKGKGREGEGTSPILLYSVTTDCKRMILYVRPSCDVSRPTRTMKCHRDYNKVAVTLCTCMALLLRGIPHSKLLLFGSNKNLVVFNKKLIRKLAYYFFYLYLINALIYNIYLFLRARTAQDPRAHQI